VTNLAFEVLNFVHKIYVMGMGVHKQRKLKKGGKGAGLGAAELSRVITI